MGRYIYIQRLLATTCTLFVVFALCACADSAATGDGTVNSDAEWSGAPPFNGGKEDAGERGCALPSFTLTSHDRTTIEVERSCGAMYTGESVAWVQFDQETVVTPTIVQAEALAGRAIGLCTLRMTYSQQTGSEQDDPVFSGWSYDAFMHEAETPCGAFIVQEDGSLRPAQEETKGFEQPLPTGWYLLGIDPMEGIPENLNAATLEIQTNGVGTARCGDGMVDATATPPETCDDGGSTPLDACSASCTWTQSFMDDGTYAEGDSPAEAMDFKGFQDIQLVGSFRGDDTDDWFAYDAPEDGELSITTRQTESTALQIFDADDVDISLYEADLEACAQTCQFSLVRGRYLLHFTETAELNATYDIHLRGPSVSPRP